MKRFAVLPAMAATAWAQQAAPSEAETAVRAQAEKYYQLMMDEKYREAEKLVAEESKDDYYNGKKPKIRGFTVLSTQLVDDTHAIVTIKAKQVVLMMGAGAQIFEIPTPTNWKLENGEWHWYIPESVKNQTPFGKVAATGATTGPGILNTKGQAPGTVDSPDFAALQGQLKVDKTTISFTPGNSQQTFTVTNGLPGPMDLSLDPHVKMIHGLTAAIDKPHLDQGEKAVVTLKRSADAKFSDEVVVWAAPLNILVGVKVEAK